MGREFSSGGFAPYTVAIHIVYFDDQNQLMFRNYTSDSNDDYEDTVGTFKEAMEKLVNCEKIHDIQTDGLIALRDYYKNGHFPTFGVVKKCP
ncbi:sce7725 family protein [Enterococcus sp. DIV0849a]|uniref:sce7725 family protein n=1 Tax=Enterococcus sp. DIV0849a TaxID=2230879 RepID=UPI0030CF7FFE